MNRVSLIALLVLTLTGGMLGSLGISTMLRSRRGRALVEQWNWWGLALYALSVLAVAALCVVWAYRSVVQAPGSDGSMGAPWPFFAFGLAAGLPFTLFTVISVRHQAKQMAERARKRKLTPASRQERIEFAHRLEAQLRDFSSELSDATVKTHGDKGTVLVVQGKVDRGQAERLVNVLRVELQDLDIERLESGNADQNWWVKV